MAQDVSTTSSGRLTPEMVSPSLAATPGADDWTVETIHDEEAQVYLIRDGLEAVRVVSNDRAQVSLCNDHAPADGSGGTNVRGSTSLTLLGDDVADQQRLESRLRDAVISASLTSNPPYPFATAPAGGYPEPLVRDPLLTGDVTTALEDTMLRLRTAAENWGTVSLASGEIYATRRRRALRNSRGIEVATHETSVFLDFVLIAREGDREAEFHAEMSRRRLSDLMIESAVDAYATFARHAVTAQLPGNHEGPVILSGNALTNFFQPVIMHASAQAAYQKFSRFTPGEVITPTDPRGDRLTLLSDALRPWGTNSHAFDSEGLPGTRVALIEDGVFTRYWAGSRYASYLGIEPTGAFGNLTVQPGTWGLDVLRSAAEGPVYEIVEFAFLDPDSISGDFTVEIRLGYRHDASGSTPIKGGTLTGNVFAALADARLSASVYSDGNYHGPAAIRFGSLRISGA